MIRPPGFRAAAFSTAHEGDIRSDEEGRRRFAGRLGIPSEWAEVRQVHGSRVVRARRPGLLGEADGLYTVARGLPVSVAVADCVPVLVEAPEAVGAVHAGWRGMAEGIVAGLLASMRRAGSVPIRAAIGPSIGPCCFEVGTEVSTRLPHHRRTTSWGTESVDLWNAAQEQLGDLEVWRSDLCTRCGDSFFSYRRDGAGSRQVGVTWLP